MYTCRNAIIYNYIIPLQSDIKMKQWSMVKSSANLHYLYCISYVSLTKIILLLVLDHHGLPPDFSNAANRNSYLFKGFRALGFLKKIASVTWIKARQDLNQTTVNQREWLKKIEVTNFL